MSDSIQLFFDKDGTPLTTLEWAGLYSSKDEDGKDYKRVAEDAVRDYWISTVWLGMNYSTFGLGPPIIFETMVFPERNDPFGIENEMLRYSTEQEAKDGHKLMVAELESRYFERKMRRALVVIATTFGFSAIAYTILQVLT